MQPKQRRNFSQNKKARKEQKVIKVIKVTKATEGLKVKKAQRAVKAQQEPQAHKVPVSSASQSKLKKTREVMHGERSHGHADVQKQCWH
nr:hypothetical protein [Providencia rettgeri]